MRHLFGGVLTALLVIPLLAFAQAGQFAFPAGTPLSGAWGTLELCSTTAPTLTPNTLQPVYCGPQTTVVTGAISPAPTGQSQYGLTQTSGFQSDGVTAVTGYTVCSIFKPAAGSAFYVGGTAAAVQTVQIYDSATIPADGTLAWKSSGGVLIESFTLPAAGPWLRTLGGGTYPVALTSGITVCYSSTAGIVKTQLGSASTNTLFGAVM